MSSPAAKPEERPPWHPGSRVQRLKASHSYRFVLALITAAFLFMSFAPDAGWSGSVLVLLNGAIVVVAAWTSGLDSFIRPALLLVGVAVVAAGLDAVVGGNAVHGGVGLLNVALIAAVIAIVGLGVIDQGEVNRQSVLGAVCVYIELGIFFAFVYGTVAVLGSGPFFAQGTDGTPSLRLYFSFVTLATLGYGDYTAAGTLGHTLSVMEALMGQLYLVTIVAVLVARIGFHRPR